MTFLRMAAAACLAAPAVAAAQAGNYAPLVLQLPAGARTLALGNTGVAGRDDDVIFFNPAQLTIANGFSASGEWLSATAGTGTLSAVTRFNGGGIGIGVRAANYEQPAGIFPATRHSMLATGADAAMSFEASVGIAQSIRGIRAGLVAKYAEDVVGSVRLSRVLADIGLSKDLFRSTIGLAVQNIGEDMDDNISLRTIKLPVRTTLGISQARSLGPYDVYVTGAVAVLRDEFVQPSGGAEVNYSWLSGYNFALRGGVRRSTLGEEPLTAGAGLTMDRLSFDYALETLSNQRIGHRFGIRLR